MSAEHTPTPWIISKVTTLLSEIGHVDENGLEWLVAGELSKEDAEYIVLAANHHDELVAALEHIVSDSQTALESQNRDTQLVGIALMGERAREALSKLRGTS